MITAREAYLVRAAKDGDGTAFEELLKPEYRTAFRLAFGMLHDRQAAEDAVQEAAFKAWRRIANLRDGARMSGWFLGIVANECRSAVRARWWSVVRVPDVPDQPDVRAEDPSALDLRRALKRLRHNQRLVLVLRYYLDLPYEQIASLLVISPKAARTRVDRALGRLKSVMRVEEVLT